MAEEKTEQQKKNYERLLLAIAILYANQLGIDIAKVDDYSKLTEGEKTFAKKIYEKYPKFQEQVNKDSRISEQTIVKDTQKILKEDGSNEVKSGRFAKWVSYGDDNVCPKCRIWENQVVCIEGNANGFQTVDDIIKAGGLHYGCRCALQDISTEEIERKAPNPRASAKEKAEHPEAYNSMPLSILTFN